MEQEGSGTVQAMPMNGETSAEEKAEEGRRNKLEAFGVLESDLAASTSASAQSEALARLESSVMETYTEAGVSAEIST